MPQAGDIGAPSAEFSLLKKQRGDYATFNFQPRPLRHEMG